MRVLGSAVLGMEFFVIGFAMLLTNEKHGSLPIWIGALIAILLLASAGLLKKKVIWLVPFLVLLPCWRN